MADRELSCSLPVKYCAGRHPDATSWWRDGALDFILQPPMLHLDFFCIQLFLSVCRGQCSSAVNDQFIESPSPLLQDSHCQSSFQRTCETPLSMVQSLVASDSPHSRNSLPTFTSPPETDLQLLRNPLESSSEQTQINVCAYIHRKTRERAGLSLELCPCLAMLGQPLQYTRASSQTVMYVV